MKIAILMAILAMIAITIPTAAFPKNARSNLAVNSFKSEHPCPASMKTRGPCPGYQVDHIMPLCAGGEDTPRNMQWLSVEEHKQKTRHDVKFCRAGSTSRMP